jgi:hypothetical protein
MHPPGTKGVAAAAGSKIRDRQPAADGSTGPLQRLAVINSGNTGFCCLEGVSTPKGSNLQVTGRLAVLVEWLGRGSAGIKSSLSISKYMISTRFSTCFETQGHLAPHYN